MTEVTNTSLNPLVLPNGPVIPARTTVPVEDWSKKASNDVVKAWIRVGALTVNNKGAAEAVASEPTPVVTNSAVQTQPPGVTAVPKTEAELEEMTVDQLKEAIELKGGAVKSTWNKAELVKQAKALEV